MIVKYWPQCFTVLLREKNCPFFPSNKKKSNQIREDNNKENILSLFIGNLKYNDNNDNKGNNNRNSQKQK